MKKILFFLFVLLFAISCSKDSSTSPDKKKNYDAGPDPTGYYKFDVKTKFSEKNECNGSKKRINSILK